MGEGKVPPDFNSEVVGARDGDYGNPDLLKRGPLDPRSLARRLEDNPTGLPTDCGTAHLRHCVKASKTALLYRPLTVAAIVRALVARSSLCADTAGLAAEEAVRVRAGRSGGLRFVRGLPSFDRRCPAREERFIIADRLALPLSSYCGPFSRLVID